VEGILSILTSLHNSALLHVVKLASEGVSEGAIELEVCASDGS
jgi:hypothetical protein